MTLYQEVTQKWGALGSQAKRSSHDTSSARSALRVIQDAATESFRRL